MRTSGRADLSDAAVSMAALLVRPSTQTVTRPAPNSPIGERVEETEQLLGRLPDDVDPRFLFLALMSVVCLPAFLPQVTALATGREVTTGAFQEEWRAFLNAFAATLGGDAPGD